MRGKYTKEELNEMLLEKNLDEFYFAILETKTENITEDEFNKTIDNSQFAKSKEKDIFDELLENDLINKALRETIKLFPCIAAVRRMAVLTMIGDDIYNIGMPSFLDLDKEKIIRFDNVTKYYDESNARVRLFTPEEEPAIKEPEMLIDLDDETIAREYEKNVDQKSRDDLTLDFIADIKGKPFTKTR